MIYATEENRMTRRDKKGRSKYDPKVGGMPLGMSKKERQLQNERKSRKHNKLGVNIHDDVDPELDRYSGVIIHWPYTRN